MNEDERSGQDSEQPTVSRSSDTHMDTIAGYRLVQKIGEGGMGVVYEADQEKPVERKVALKLIKLGMDTKAVIANSLPLPP